MRVIGCSRRNFADFYIIHIFILFYFVLIFKCAFLNRRASLLVVSRCFFRRIIIGNGNPFCFSNVSLVCCYIDIFFTFKMAI